MNRYKATFNLKNGIRGEIMFTAENDGDAFMTGCKMFALAETVEWKIDKVESNYSLKSGIREIAKHIESMLQEVKIAIEAVEAERNSFEKENCDEAIDNLDSAMDYLEDVKGFVDEAKDLLGVKE